MKTVYDAIVVGGGLAGLTSAAYLCHYRYRTLLCEKGKKTGGLVNTFWHQGFAFDAGIRAFENSGILFPMLKSLGINIDFTDNQVSVGIEKQWVKLADRDSLNSYASMLCALFPDNASQVLLIAEEIKKVMGYMNVLYGIDNPLFMDNMRDRDYLTKTLLPWLLKYQVNIRKASRLDMPIQTYLQRFTQNEALIDMITQHFFKDTPAFFALSYFWLYLDYCYPKGGTGVFAEKMTDFVLTAGGEIMTQAAVNRVDLSGHELELADGRLFQYKKLIWAADQKTLYAMTGGQNSPHIEKQRRLVEQSTGGDSILTLFIGVNLDKQYIDSRCGVHAFYTPSTEGLNALPAWEETAEQGDDALLNWVGDYLARTTYEISCPVLRDRSLAPEDKTGLIISTLMDYHLARHFSDNGGYDAFKVYCTDKIIATLDASLLGGIRENLIFALCSTPMTIEKETGNAQGAITGWAFTNTAMPAENRFRKITNAIYTPLSDVYQCGQWSFSPSGLPVSVLTGKLTADAVRKSLKGTAQ